MRAENEPDEVEDDPRLSRREFVAASGSLGAFAFVPRFFQDSSSASDAGAGVLGPFVGACAPGEMRVWLRKPPGGGTGIRLFSSLGPQTKEAPALERADGCKTFLFDRLPSIDTRSNAGIQWTTSGDLPPPDVIRDRKRLRRVEFEVPMACYPMAHLRLALGSCANEKPGETNPAWKALLAANPDALVLLGDTPYIDTTDLDVQCRRYREFYSSPDLAALMSVTPTWATWDDHDFAGDGADGNAKGKEHARKAFVEYHALSSYGENDQGIYTRFKLGAADVFLLDTRWFSGTEPSFADATKKTLLGKQQWEWLQRGLKESKAPFKLLACGMVWNGAVRPNKPDYWMAYPHERKALFDFLAKEKISGVVLASGDIHRSRVYAFPPEDTGVPYPLHELVTSPLGNHPMAAANVASPDLRFDSDAKHQFLLLDVTTEKLVARFHAAATGEIHNMELSADDLRPHVAITPAPRSEEWALPRTNEVLARSGADGARVLFLGDSITEGFEIAAGAELWKQHLAPLGAVNLGVSGERTENLLWRLDHGQVEGWAKKDKPPELAVLLLGTNNFGYGAPSTPAEVAQGIAAIVARLRRKLPSTRVLVLGIFPRRDRADIPADSIPRANALAARLADEQHVFFADFGGAFLEPDGTLSTTVMPDLLHLTTEGYRRWLERLRPLLARHLRG